MPESTDTTAARLPATAKYSLVSLDLDTTGRRLIDEIVHLSAYTPSEQYSEYLMPYMNLNPAARQRHQIRVISIGFFRTLKNMRTGRVLKSKSEITVLKEFLEWLEQLQEKEDSDGVILMCHEDRKFVPYMMMEAMRRYDLEQRFQRTVKSFVAVHEIAVAEMAGTEGGDDAAKTYSMKELAKALDKDVPAPPPTSDAESASSALDEFEGCAYNRARLAYEICAHLTRVPDEKASSDDEDSEEPRVAARDEAADRERMYAVVLRHAFTMQREQDELKTQNQNLVRAGSFRTIFMDYFKTDIYHRVKAVTFRRVLSEHGFSLDSIQEVWNEGKMDGLTAAFESMDELKPEERTELVALLDSHFDSEKETIRPTRRSTARAPTSPARRRSSGRHHNQSHNTSAATSPGHNTSGTVLKGVTTTTAAGHPTRRRPRNRNHKENARQPGGKPDPMDTQKLPQGGPGTNKVHMNNNNSEDFKDVVEQGTSLSMAVPFIEVV